MLEALQNIVKIGDLRRKLLATFGILVLFRLVAHVPVPGVDFEALRQVLQTNQILDLLNLFSGGTLSRFSVASMGVYPYITASIVLQLVIPLVPSLEALTKEGEQGRQKLNQYTLWLTIPLAALQAYGQAVFLASNGVIKDFNLFRADTFLPTLTIIVAMTAGTMLLVWFGTLIDEYGIGNGVSIIIFAGIVARMPAILQQLLVGQNSLIGTAAFLIIGFLTVYGIVLVQEGQRRIPVQYAKRVRGRRMYGGVSTHLPLQVNMAGMIPLIFASSLLIFPSTVAAPFTTAATPWVRSLANGVLRVMDSRNPFFWVMEFILVVLFTYFYTIVIFGEQNIAENLQRNGGFIPGIRPGPRTKEYLNRVVTRITVVGALFLGTVAVIPYFVQLLTGVQNLTISSTALLIVVGVAVDTIKQLEAQLLMRQYEGILS